MRNYIMYFILFLSLKNFVRNISVKVGQEDIFKKNWK